LQPIKLKVKLYAQNAKLALFPERCTYILLSHGDSIRQFTAYSCQCNLIIWPPAPAALGSACHAADAD